MDESVIERVLLWMISGLGGGDLENAAISKLGVDPTAVKGVIADARKRLTLAADYNRDELLGTALTRLNDLYSRCMRGGADGTGPNFTKALDVQKEINRLAGLYKSPALGGMGEAAGADSEQELQAIADYLLPLALTSSDYPLREHARLAAQHVREHQTT